jgi:hypothetical protein
LLLTLSPFLSPAPTAAPRAFGFTNFVTEVTHNLVKTASIGPNGQVSGRLANGETYTSQVPTAIPDAELQPSYEIAAEARDRQDPAMTAHLTRCQSFDGPMASRERCMRMKNELVGRPSMSYNSSSSLLDRAPSVWSLDGTLANYNASADGKVTP